MSIWLRKCTFVVGLIVVLAMGLALPAQAAYTKLYGCLNATGVSQSSVRVVVNGLEAITASATGCCAWWMGWPAASTGYTATGGVFCTTLTFGGAALGPSTYGQVAWTTADGSCRLRDLRWGNGASVVPSEQVGVPGGGMVFYDDPVPGCLTVVITNDTDAAIDLSEVEFAISGEELSLETLADLMGGADSTGPGFVELHVANIDADIDVLLAEVESYGAAGELSGPSANSLIGKLDRAAAYKHDGLDKYLAGDVNKALFLWGKAAGHMENFVSQVTAASQKGNLGLDLYNRWIVDGGGEIATAPEIRDALLALPEGESLQSLPPLPEGAELPPSSGLDPDDYVEWPVESLAPGKHTAFVICGGDEETAVIMGGSMVDEDGNTVLDWMEQSSPEPVDTQPPVIACACTSAAPAQLTPDQDHSMVEIALNVMVEDDGYATWYVEGVSSNQPEGGTGPGDLTPDWWVDPDDPQSLWLRAELAGTDGPALTSAIGVLCPPPIPVREYTITLRAIDTGGNLSEPCQLVVPVIPVDDDDHDDHDHDYHDYHHHH